MTALIRRRIARTVLASMVLGWGASSAGTAALAASEPDLLGLPWVQILIGVFIAGWGGLSATLGRWLAARYNGQPWFWPGELMRDLAVGVAVGMGSYFMGAAYGLKPMQLGLVLLLAGFLGVRLLGGLAERLLGIVTRPGSMP